MKKSYFALISAILFSSSVHAQFNFPIDMILGKSQTKSKEECKDCAGTIRTWNAKPSATPLEFNNLNNLRPPPAFGHIVNSNTLVGLLLLDGNNVVYEKYYSEVERETQVISFSRAKSMAALALGKALCTGKVSSLQDSASKYVPELKNTVYGKSKISSLLEMSSGASTGLPHGDVVQGEASRWVQGVKSQLDTLIQYDSQFLTGEGVYKYKNQDPAVVALILDRIYDKNMDEYFQKNVWDAVKAKSIGTWALDKNSVPIFSSFLMASSGDWGRVGLYINSLLRNESQDECMSGFMREAASLKKRTGWRLFQGYGYYFWVNNLMDNKNQIIWMNGVGGQLVAMHPPTNKVMVYNSLSDVNLEAVSSAFIKWVYQ